MKPDDMLLLRLPPLREDDSLFSKKKELLSSMNHDLTFGIKACSSSEELLQVLERMVRTARIHELSEVELYFMEEDECGPLSFRNEIESLNSVLSIIQSYLANAKPDNARALITMGDAVVDRICSMGDQNVVEVRNDNIDVGAEMLLLEWAKDLGLRTNLGIAYFEGSGRGAVALEDLSIGDTVLEVPESLIISEDLVYKSEMIEILKDMDVANMETMLLLWSMKERHATESKFKHYFKTLPEKFNTGLSFGIEAMGVLEGTLLFEELLGARQHLRNQYDALCPELCRKHPNIFPPELYSWDQFLWACELWYSNSMKVVFSDGKQKTCLIPVAGFLNHSLCSHITNYGRIDSTSKSLKFRLSRTCKRGEQCYLSYGSFPGSHAVTFYGFLPKGDNPYDTIPLDFDASNNEECGLPRENAWDTHMVRGTWLSKRDVPSRYGLPPPLLDHLRTILMADVIDPFSASEKDVNKEEKEMLEMLVSIFSPMMDALGSSDDFERGDSDWDVELASEYRHLQQRIISSVLASCGQGLKMLDEL